MDPQLTFADVWKEVKLHLYRLWLGLLIPGVFVVPAAIIYGIVQLLCHGHWIIAGLIVGIPILYAMGYNMEKDEKKTLSRMTNLQYIKAKGNGTLP
jgi:H+/gluconate symporter-like permease